MFGDNIGGNINPTKGREKDGEAAKRSHTGQDGDGKGGDGFHHHELHEHESGLHSKHTHPDGREEHADHGSYEEAADHMHRMFGHEGQEPDEGEHAEPDEDDTPDFSGAYSRG